jgi:predicted RNA-binding Zn-ribbon protein involved in translation (DUF1610 family)
VTLWDRNIPVYPAYTPVVYQHPVVVQPNTCGWFDDKGNERFMYFTSCGAQVQYDEPWWVFCPKCGGRISRASPPAQQEGK